MSLSRRVKRLEDRTEPPDGPMKALMLRSEGDTLIGPDGREFCTLEEFERARSGWRGLPAIVIRRQVVAPGPDGEPRKVGPGPVRVTYIDGHGIDTPDTFRARML